ncbi:MAG: hypothetical protein WA749_01505 [Gelidibacter sp.]
MNLLDIHGLNGNLTPEEREFYLNGKTHHRGDSGLRTKLHQRRSRLKGKIAS